MYRMFLTGAVALFIAGPETMWAKSLSVESAPKDDAIFTNPVVAPESSDPWVTRRDGYYYYLRTTGSDIQIVKTIHLQDIGHTPAVVVWRPDANTPIKSDIWAPELHFLDGSWYIYASGNEAGGLHLGIQQMFVLEATSSDPLGSYVFKGILAPETYAIDETVLTDDTTHSRYLVWSQFERGGQALYIAPMPTPWELGEPRVRISWPQYDWEMKDGAVNEAPQILKGPDHKVFIVYSASGCWSDFYALGLLTNTSGQYLDPVAWHKEKSPVFHRSNTNHVFAVGHASFTTSAAGDEDWMIYHGASKAHGNQEDRSTRMQRFTWSKQGLPRFGEPLPDGVRLRAPSEKI